MADEPRKQFGKRRPVVPLATPPGPPAKRSSHVALLLMGTFAVGGGAYALMPRENCQPGIATPPGSADCGPRGSSSGGHGYWGGSSRSSFFSGDSGTSRASSGSSEAGSSGVTRGGFGSFARAFGSHFSSGS